MMTMISTQLNYLDIVEINTLLYLLYLDSQTEISILPPNGIDLKPSIQRRGDFRGMFENTFILLSK